MSRARVFAGLAVLGLAAFAVAAYARQRPVEEGDAPEAFAPETSWTDLVPDGITQSIWSLGNEVDYMQSLNTQPGFSVAANVAAFLEAIKRCEGTAGQPDPYRVCFAYRHTIDDLSEHPAVTGEWRGEPLSATQCAGAGLGPGCVSTAAGAYQMIKPTWVAMRDKLGLRDFGPASQDLAAVGLLRKCGAYARLEVGDLIGAVSRAKSQWASLPGANYAGQGMRTMAQVQAWYSSAGGGTA